MIGRLFNPDKLQKLKLLLLAIKDLLFTYFNIPYTPHSKLQFFSNKIMFIFACSIKHVYGKRYINYNADDLIIVCPIKNGEEYIQTFIEHHLSLGIKHIIFLDNGSNDNSIQIARKFEDVTVLQTKLPFRTYMKYFRPYLIKRFSRNCWCLSIDIDELFDYPFSDRLSVKSLLTYLNQNSYNCVLSYMLEMFSDKPIDALEKSNSLDIKEEYRFYDLAGIEKIPISGPVNLSDENLCFYRTGGIRATVFDRAGGPISKYPLLFISEDFTAESIRLHHAVKGARIADFSALLLHYKFTKSIRNQCVKAIEEKNYSNESQKYKQFYDLLMRHPQLNLKQEANNPREFNKVNELVENGFLYVSDSFSQFAALNNS